MRTATEAYNEAILCLQQRHEAADQSIVACKNSYRLGLHVAIEQLKTSFYGVLPKENTSTQPNLEQRPAQGFEGCMACFDMGRVCRCFNEVDPEIALQMADDESERIRIENIVRLMETYGLSREEAEEQS